MRRGAEREIADLGRRIAARGHRLRLLTGTPEGITQRRRYGDMRVRYVRPPLVPALERRGFSDETAFAAVTFAGALTSRADIVHSWLYGDGYGVAQAQRLRSRRPFVLKLTGVVKVDRMARLPVDNRMLRGALAAADEVWCNSRFARDEMAEFGVPMHIVPAGVDVDAFRPAAERHDRPVVLSASAPNDPRKRLVDLFDAWPAVLDATPDARLRVAGTTPGTIRDDLLGRLPTAVRDTVAFLGDLDSPRLAAEYGRAWVCAAPAVYEALGLTTLEALACGTPVAGARSGATTELLDADGVGTLFEPADPGDLAAAVTAAFDLAADPGARERCRKAALPYAWEEIVDRILDRYRALVDRSAA